MRIVCAFVVFIFLFSALSSRTYADVIVHDNVTLKDRELMLRAETRGALLSKGGELVEFFVNGKSIGKNLSGRDGFAVKRYTPLKAGLYKIRIQSGDDKDNGVLLALDRRAKMVFIDVEGSLLDGPFGMKAKPGSAGAVKKIVKRFPVVFLQKGFLSVKAIRSWLKENNFPDAPILSWNRGDVLREIKEKDLSIKAIVGGAEVIDATESKQPLAFSFDSVEDAEVVENWGEIEKKLK
ncbi:MAG: hypothetical protein ABFD82_12955 [Syntrophaceae bacterium]